MSSPRKKAAKKWAKCGAPGCKPGCSNCDGPKERARQAKLQPRKPVKFKHLTSFMNAKGTAWGEKDDGGSFRPKGVCRTVSDSKPVKATKFAARIITGLNDFGHIGLYEDLIEFVNGLDRVVTIQGGRIKTHPLDLRREGTGAQVLLLNTNKLTKLDFKNEVAAIAEKLCVEFRHHEVIVELQRDGVAIETFGVVPD